MQQVAQLRQLELQYYVEHIGGIQTMATLLAGFAFTAFIGISEGAFNLRSLFFVQQTGALDGSINGSGALQIEPIDSPFDAMAWVKFVVETLEICTIAITLGEMLYVMIETLIARQLGSRLALRGADGSINVANRHLAAALADSTRHFVLGLQWFLFSVLLHAIRGIHPGASVLVLLIILRYWKRQFSTIARLAAQFKVCAGATCAARTEAADPRAATGVCLLLLQ